jgi:hypothetical protein
MVGGSNRSSCSYCCTHGFICGQFELVCRLTTSPYPHSRAFKATIELELTFKTLLLDLVRKDAENLQGTFAYICGMMDFKREELGMDSGDMPWAVRPFGSDMMALGGKAGEVQGQFSWFQRERERVRKARFSLARIRKAKEEDLVRFEAENDWASSLEGSGCEDKDCGEGCSYRGI